MPQLTLSARHAPPRTSLLTLEKAVSSDDLLNAFHILLAADNDDFINQSAALKGSERIRDGRLAQKRNKLLAVGNAHARGTARRYDNGGNKIAHSFTS